ncbi:hypothetical protein BKH46_08840 [Helicobacter sp. 12S02634-8]|uniref:hypothetical protein n=1 Tax=Helicobacter sp. 12S02634-8 TaxID=1476199 RepID=UPI000BA67DC5|nr:hypothetical protein [Helicobacter sp. 12S02634-8]PAF46143.1 hypothetical protein BKH46_08840 [Helicobacter sp. 12S02634-8]
MSLERELSKHIAKAINKTAKAMLREQVKAIKAEVDIPTKQIRKMVKATRATPSNLQASLSAISTHISIKHFKKSLLREGKKVIGVNVKPKKGSVIQLKGHFIAKSKTTGGEFIAIRENSKHPLNAEFSYKPSKKAYQGFGKDPQRLMYPVSKRPFDEVTKEISEPLQKRVREVFLQNLEL